MADTYYLRKWPKNTQKLEFVFFQGKSGYKKHQGMQNKKLNKNPSG